MFIFISCCCLRFRVRFWLLNQFNSKETVCFVMLLYYLNCITCYFMIILLYVVLLTEVVKRFSFSPFLRRDWFALIGECVPVRLYLNPSVQMIYLNPFALLFHLLETWKEWLVFSQSILTMYSFHNSMQLLKLDLQT